MGEKRGAYRVWVEKTEGKNHLEDRGINGRIIFRWIFRKWGWGGGVWTELIRLRIGTGGGHLKVQ